MIPKGPAANTTLSKSKPLISIDAPSPGFPKILSSGTSQFSNINSDVFEPRIPSLSIFFPTENPTMSFSTINADIPFEPAEGSVLAYIIRTSASGPFVIHIFVPFNRYVLLPCFSACNDIETTSDPEFGSLIAKAPIFFPEHNSGKYLFFCSWVPFLLI